MQRVAALSAFCAVLCGQMALISAAPPSVKLDPAWPRLAFPPVR
jgi:hypothetical protein